jgi:hypothetical protein
MGDYKKVDFDGDISDEMLGIAFDNSYRIFIGETTFREIVKNDDDGVVVLAHDPKEGFTDENLEDIILYYEYVEYYERCGVLKGLIGKRNKKKG